MYPKSTILSSPRNMCIQNNLDTRDSFLFVYTQTQQYNILLSTLDIKTSLCLHYLAPNAFMQLKLSFIWFSNLLQRFFFAYIDYVHTIIYVLRRFIHKELLFILNLNGFRQRHHQLTNAFDGWDPNNVCVWQL